MLEEIEETYPDGDVLVVSHKATLRIMLCTLLGIDAGRYRDRLAMPVTAPLHGGVNGLWPLRAPAE